jgi:signal transduction histidine kinase/DNA-binding response OmpR family regulator/streptogramin lyase
MKFLLLLLVFILPLVSAGQQNSYIKSFLTVDDGLSHNEVTSIAQDHDGFIWIGTRGGLNRYDGYEFKVFNQVPGDSNSLVNPSIESLFVDSKGNIWIGTKSGGVSKYNPDSGNFKNMVSNYEQTASILPGNRILSFYEDKQGRIWIGTWGQGLVIYDESTQTAERHLIRSQINSIVDSPDGRIWMGTNNGLYQYVEASGTFEQQNLPPYNFACRSLEYDTARNVLWVATGSSFGLVKFDLENKTSTRYRIGEKFVNPDVRVHVYESVSLDNSGKIWLGTWGNGFYLFDPEKEEFARHAIYPENRPASNKDYDAVLKIFHDKDQNLWLGTNGGGICVFTPKLEFQTVGFNQRRNKGLKNTRLMSIVDDKAGNLWLGTIGSGLVWSPNREDFYPVEYPAGVDKSRFFTIKHLYRDNSFKIWAGTNIGTFLIELTNGQPRMIYAAKKLGNPVFKDQMVSLLDADDILLLGTLENGLFVLDKNRNFKTLKHLLKNQERPGALNSDRISYLLKDAKNRIWLGTYNGLHIYNPADTSVHQIEKYFDISGDFTGNIITCIDEDSNGNIWVGTPNGLNQLAETAENRFEITYFTQEEGLASNFVKGISHDSIGNVWVSTNIGISKYTAQSGEFINYNEADGVKGKNFTEAAVHRNHAGELFFGGSSGLTYFWPEEIKAQPTTNRPVFTDFKIFNQSVAVNQKFGSKTILRQSVLHTKKIVIPFRFNNFEIQFSALDYKSQGKNSYKFLLENYDENWNDIGDRRFLVFNNLKPGKYVLKVKASNSHNAWNPNPALLQIEILPPFWQTWYALVFYILLVTGIVIIIRWNAVKQVRLVNSLEMEKMQHGQDQKISELKLQFFTNISHEFRTPLTLILAPLKEILSTNQSTQTSGEIMSKIQVIQKNAQRLMKLINQLLDFRKAETGNMKLVARDVDLEEFVQEVAYPFNELAKINEIKFKVRSKIKTKNCWVDREKLEIILNNLISNAFKFTKQKGEIEVALHEEENDFLIAVSDNGKGIQPTEINHIFDRFYRVEKSENFGSSGIGLALVKRLVELHKGSITVSSTPNKRTEFVVSLPKGKSHLSPDEMAGALEHDHGFVKSEPIFAGMFHARTKAKPKSEQCILIVEDNPEVNSYLESLLGPLYNIKVAFDGMEGYRTAVDSKPDLIISDVMMPKMDGFELCKKIKSNGDLATTPVILLTAKSAENFKLLGTQTGADAYISKPFDPNYLIEKIANLLLSKKKFQKQYSKSVRLEPSAIEITNADEVFIAKTMELIESNMQNHNFSSDVLAQGLNMSNSSLYRKLKELTGQSTAGFIRSMKIKRAAQLLADKQLTITEIAYDVGFNDVKHFRTVFQKQFGCTPSEHREKIVKK